MVGQPPYGNLPSVSGQQRPDTADTAGMVIAIENGPVEIVDFPMKSMVIFQFVM